MSFIASISGLNGTASALDVTSNNIANGSTNGFKKSANRFTDVFSAVTQSGTALGTTFEKPVQSFTQGDVKTTDRNLDLAINGNGMFQLKDPKEKNVSEQLSYTRDGHFGAFKFLPPGVEKDETIPTTIVNVDKKHVLGWPAGPIGPDGKRPLKADPLVPTSSLLVDDTLPGKATTKTWLNVNLSSQANPPTIKDFDPGNPSSYNSATAQTVLDSEGEPHTLMTYFARGQDANGQDDKTWRLFTRIEIPKLNDQTGNVEKDESGKIIYERKPPVGEPPGGRVISFGKDGHLLGEVTYPDPENPKTKAFNPTTYSNTFDLKIPVTLTPTQEKAKAEGKPYTQKTATIGAIENNITKSTQFAAPFSFQYSNQNGQLAGILDPESITVAFDGIVQAKYVKGLESVTVDVGIVALVHFNDKNALRQVGSSAWSDNEKSGPPQFGRPGGTNGHGLLQAGALENSNVDMTMELFNLITLQRTYQANSQAIKTQDQMLQTLVGMK